MACALRVRGGAGPSGSLPLLRDDSHRGRRGASQPTPRRRERDPCHYSDRLLGCSQCIPEPPDSCLTSSPTTALASPNSIQVLSEKYSSLSIPANPGFLLRLMARTVRALSASTIGMP